MDWRRPSQRKKLAEDASADGRKVSTGRFSGFQPLDNMSEVTVSTSGCCSGSMGNLGNHGECNILSVSNLPPDFLTRENPKENAGENGQNSAMGDKYDRLQVNEIDSYGSWRNRGSLRTKSSYRHSLKPLSSLESCMMAQLYREHERMEEYVRSALPSPSTTIRPLLVTNGDQIVGPASGDYLSQKTVSDENKKDTMSGVPPLPKLRSLDFPKKMKSRTGKHHSDRLSSSSKMSSGTHFLFQKGPDDKMLLFSLGISIGIISSLIANRRELDKLKGLLRQTENLVQDLQEELEMKDTLTVKEIEYENSDLQDTVENSLCNRAPNPPLPVHNVDNAACNAGVESHKEKEMSKIEAELEAEFQRLGVELNSSTLERRLSDHLELDLDFEADFAQGELRPDMVDGQAAARMESDQDASGTLTRASENYAVSPRELTLRLQNVIQSRLEERVKELEMALQNSQRKLQLMESGCKNARKMLSSELQFSSGKQSPNAEGDGNSEEPLVLNLSGEAPDAYNETCEDPTLMNESDEEDSLSEFYQNNHHLGVNPFDNSMFSAENGQSKGPLPHSPHDKAQTSEKPSLSRLKTLTKHGSGVQELLYDVVSDKDSSDDEIHKQLIKQIVEKTKKGSPVVLNAQRLLFSLDESDD